MQSVTAMQQATAQVAAWKQQGDRVVFSNGCFDLLHPGHVDYLSRAAALGEHLVIGLNDDDSIRRLKGPSRPVNPLATRATMLAALRTVDLVVAFSEDTPLNLIRALMPDVLVKGGDYRVDDIVGAPEVRAHGGDVVVVPFLEGYSSTALIRRIQHLI